ncbi:LysM peptidoglycan-binding domain-containing protein [Aliiglaciecola sp. 3_MG-2023]|uniref:LysM peptidoglycan-binding domain-containing protein n=1 Tax=Aliiglaciecola sp. 3_MG-2023 TaxID=3062644 RepID=UPI0026E4282A|nr:LysM peptidoglycan-binding domain-containing protein [Aliiglaciecola sp. 3_MG-2023]MDO6694793.1 LysM peptidoglycan-binding domain-containing protein [Aliiglaciecola sp. 3_MG-2023]
MKMTSFSLLMVLAGCQTFMADSHADVEKETHQEQLIAEQINKTCEQKHALADELFDCTSASHGTIPVTHPTEIVEITVEPDNYVELPNDEVTSSPDSTESPDNLWLRIKHQLTFPIPDNERLNAQKNWYLKHSNYMQRVATRAKPFMHYIVEQIEKNQLPLELVFLPIVESAFDPFAYSHGRAAGMWQFIPGTGKRFGMKQTWWYDGRRDVVASTEGAIAYLIYLHKMFDGDWLHALAAYNSGEGRVRSAIRKNKKAGKPTDFWSLDLPKETRAYVPKLLALSSILKDSDENNIAWTAIPNKPFVKVVDVESQIDLALAADLAGLTLKELHSLNAGFNRWATDPDGPHRLLLPIESVENFELALNNIEENERLNWVRHKVKSGDSLLKLAKQYHTTVDVIKGVNDMQGNLIRLGEYILVPVSLKSLDSYSLSQDQRLASTQSKPRGTYSLKHKVQSGDTFWDLSRKYKVDMRSLAKWNGMAPNDPLMPGKDLVIWLKQASESQRKDAVMRSLTYTVRKGDSLARIANKFKVNLVDLKRWNQDKLRKYLQPGQKIKVYVDVTRT